jgi:hypothetical protein
VDGRVKPKYGNYYRETAKNVYRNALILRMTDLDRDRDGVGAEVKQADEPHSLFLSSGGLHRKGRAEERR